MALTLADRIQTILKRQSAHQLDTKSRKADDQFRQQEAARQQQAIPTSVLDEKYEEFDRLFPVVAVFWGYTSEEVEQSYRNWRTPELIEPVLSALRTEVATYQMDVPRMSEYRRSLISAKEAAAALRPRPPSDVEVAHQRERAHQDRILGSVKCPDDLRDWLASIVEVIPAKDRGQVLQEYDRLLHSGPGRESDRIREANVWVLGQAKQREPARTEAVQAAYRKRNRAS